MSVPPVVYDGVYGPYTVTGEHRREVLAYRLSLLLVALAQVALLLQWRWLGPSWCWPWLLLMAAGLGGALRWVHIYLVPLHRALQLFWLLGCAGFGLLAYRAGAASMLPQLEQRLALPAGTLEPVLPPVSLRRCSAGPGLGRFTLGSIDVFTTWQGSVVYGLVMLLSLLVLNRQRHDLAVRNSVSFEPVSVEMTGLQDAAPDQEPAEQTQPASAASDQLPDADAGLLTFTLQESRQLQLTDGRGTRLTLDAATGTISLPLQPPLELQLQPDPLTPDQVQVFWNGEPLSPEEGLMGVYRIEPTKVDAPALERPQMDPLSP